MSMPGFTAEVSIYQSAQRYVMASSIAPTRGVGLASIAATIIPLRGPGDCQPGCFCNYPGIATCWTSDCEIISQHPCDWYGNRNVDVTVFPIGCFYNCSYPHCKGGVCDTVAVFCDPFCYPALPDCPTAPLPRC